MLLKGNKLEQHIKYANKYNTNIEVRCNTNTCLDTANEL